MSQTNLKHIQGNPKRIRIIVKDFNLIVVLDLILLLMSYAGEFIYSPLNNYIKYIMLTIAKVRYGIDISK
ncbi:hypothetical protein CHH75_13675 [Paenibacillus sp. 7541]|nr:hypothetical protein CHH75_13675 [Paenibacillus sp. 7541]